MRTSIAGLLATVALSACITAPKPPTPAEIREVHDDVTEAMAGLTPSQYADAGMQYVDGKCDAFFEGAKTLDRRTAAAQGAANLWSGTLTGLLAADQRSAENIARAALLFSGLDAQIGNYREQELLGPFASSAHLMVTQAREAFRRQPQPATPTDAAHRVHQYAQLCSITTIHRFINDAMGQATPVLQTSSTSLLSEADRAVVVAALDVLAPAAGVEGLNSEEWSRLYVYLADGPGNAALISAFAAEFPAQRTALLDTGTPVARTSAGDAVLAQLSAVRARIPAFADATQEVRRLRENAVEAAKAAAALRPGTSPTPVGLPYRSTTSSGVIVIR